MSCMIAPHPGGTPEIFPLPWNDMAALQKSGKAAAKELGLKDADFTKGEYIGAAMKTDGKPFYLWASAPDLKTGESKPWKGAFFAPFGVGNIHGRVEAAPGDKKSKFAITQIDVAAELKIRGKTSVAASWTVIGSQLTVPNKAAMIKSVAVENPGPHDIDDVRRCIALHAPDRVLGEPRAIVAMQCGVAAACLIEAIC